MWSVVCNKAEWPIKSTAVAILPLLGCSLWQQNLGAKLGNFRLSLFHDNVMGDFANAKSKEKAVVTMFHMMSYNTGQNVWIRLWSTALFL